jgi:enoyl-CoA hydratase/carnithine racemase
MSQDPNQAPPEEPTRGTPSGPSGQPGSPLDGVEDLAVQVGDDGVALVTLSLPERRNAMSAAMTASWERVMAHLRTDRRVRAVVVTGEGSAFCSGGDVAWIGSEPGATVDQHRTRMFAFYRAWLSVRDLEVPTIAAVNGAAIGAGLALALACDLRYAAEDARLGAPFTALGMHPGMASTFLLPEVAGLGVAREMLLTGRIVTGAEAVGMGLVNRTFPAAELLEQAMSVAAAVAATAPIATRLTKQALASDATASFEAALQWEALAQPVTLATSDLQEGLAAQRERRPPRFTGT